MRHSYNMLAFTQRNNYVKLINDYYYVAIPIVLVSSTTLKQQGAKWYLADKAHALYTAVHTIYLLLSFPFSFNHTVCLPRTQMCLSAHREIRFFFCFIGLPHWFEMTCLALPVHLAASAYSQCASFFFLLFKFCWIRLGACYCSYIMEQNETMHTIQINQPEPFYYRGNSSEADGIPERARSANEYLYVGKMFLT